MPQFREANMDDVPVLAMIRAMGWGTVDYWEQRISGYLNCELYPQQALNPRIIYLAYENDEPVGLIAGHFTRRFECDGELEWIDVIPAYQRKGIASGLLKL